MKIASHHAPGGSKALLLPVLVLTLGVAPSTASFAIGIVAHSDTSTISASGYGKPNQHRVWYNSYQHGWDGLIPKNDGGLSASDHYIMKDVAVNQIFTPVELEDRNSGRPDVFWDDAGKRLYVLGSHETDSRFWLVNYDDVTDTYSVANGRRGVSVPGVTHAGPNDPATLYVSPNGYVWVAVMRDGGLFVQRSVDGGTSWLPAAINLDAAVLKGVTAWNHFTNQGATQVTVFASENAILATPTHVYYWRIDQNADPSVPTSWTDESASIPAPGTANADDHVSAARDSLENQYFVVKTQDGSSSDPLIDLYRRTREGAWSQFKVTQTRDRPEQSRPSIVIDEENDQISIYTNDTQGGAGRRKRARLSSLQNLATAPLTTVFSAAGSIFSDLISPRQAVTSASRTLILANEVTHAMLWSSSGEPIPETVCQIRAGTLMIKKHELDWKLANVGTVPATISLVDLTWPAALGNLKEVKREGDSIYKTSTPPPSVQITSFLGDRKKRTIDRGKTITIKLMFSRDVPTTRDSYRLRLAFEEGCEVELTP